MVLLVAATLSFGCSQTQETKKSDDKTKTKLQEDNKAKKDTKGDNKKSNKGKNVKIYYLEVVTPDIDAACNLYSKMYGVKFGDPIQSFGGARTAKLDGGGMIGIRGPLRKTEEPVVRFYVLVDDIKKAVAAAKEAGAKIAMGPMKIGGQGQFAVLIHGGIESGLWQK